MLVGMERAGHLRAGPWPHTEQRSDVDDRWDAKQRVCAQIAFAAIIPATLDGSAVDLGSMCDDVSDVEADRRFEPERFDSGVRARVRQFSGDFGGLRCGLWLSRAERLVERVDFPR